MPESLLGGQGATLLTAVIIVTVALLALVGVFWLIRARASSTFIRGGKNRMPRLAVLDATAVDTRRRLVLIRRDDVEHLIMIGGPTDIVIESRIAPQGTKADLPQPQQQEQRLFNPAPQQKQSAPDTVPAFRPERSSERAVERTAQARPAPPALPNPPVAANAPSAPKPAMTAPAAKPSSASTAGSIRSEAADVLDNARTRVFEEPSFDESAFDELTAVPPPVIRAKPATQASSPPSPAPAFPAPASPVSSATSVSAATTATVSAAGAIRAEDAANLLESARTRVFEEPDMNETSYDDSAQSPAPAAPARSSGSTASAASPRPPVRTSAQAGPDFEAVLAAELSDGLSLDVPEESSLTEPFYEHQLDAREAELIEAPEVKPEPSRGSLEEEMERLLGDLARKP